MAYTKPDFEKEYLIKNAKVAGFCKLTCLKKGTYGYNYQLEVLVDDKIAKEIKKDADTALKNLEEDYGTAPKPFDRITKFLKIKKSKDTGKILEKIPCPEGKTLIKLNMDAKEKNGVLGRIVHVFDAHNNVVKDVVICEGSIINTKFKIRSYTNNTGNGLSLILMYVQILKLETLEKLSAESPFEADENGFNIKDIETQYTDDDELPEAEDEEEI